ncbi:hypothetical protein DW876_11840 [Hungatella hathewayi]|nr:hypothetical protein DW876_11840 [Hungatella hathewayi]
MTGFSTFLRALIFFYIASLWLIIQEEKEENNWRIPTVGTGFRQKRTRARRRGEEPVIRRGKRKEWNIFCI